MNMKIEKYTVNNFQRAGAYLIDWYLGAMCGNFPLMVIYIMNNHNGDIRVNLMDLPKEYWVIGGVLAILCYSIYSIILPTYVWKGQTVGKRIMKFKVKQIDGRDVTLKNMILRELVGAMLFEGYVSNTSSYLRQMIQLQTNVDIMHPSMYIFGALTLISVIIAFLNPRRRMIHDYIAGTYVCSIK